MSLVQEKKRYFVGPCETRFVERHVSILVKRSKLGAKNFNKICPKSVQNALNGLYKRDFSKNLRGAMPPDPLEPFSFLNLLQINSAGKNYA